LNNERRLSSFLQAATELLDAERATLFIVDEEAKELWSRVAGGTSQEIRLPMTQGLAGEAAVKRRTRET
jgi:hypothetical protein